MRATTRRGRGLKVPAFFYGSYMDPQVLKRFGATPTEARPARVPGWELTFTPHANMRPSEDGLVHGFIFELVHEELQRLYGPQGFVTTYQPVPVLAQTEAGNTPCLTFVEQAAPATPEPQYLDAFLDICARLGLPEEYVARIEHEAQRLPAATA